MIHDFWNELLPDTIKWARLQSSYYKDHIPDIAVSSVEDLTSIPITTKEEIRSAGDSICASSQKPCLAQHTSGSTAKPLIIYRSKEEIEFNNNFFSDVYGNKLESPHAVLHLTNQGHGSKFPMPSSMFSFSGSIYDYSFVPSLAIDLLTHSDVNSPVPIIRYLTGLTSHVEVFSEIISRECDNFFDKHNVELIVLTGTLATKRMVKRLESIWCCDITDRLTMTEFTGGAKKINDDPSYRFDPHIKPEVINPVTHFPCNLNEPGLLVLTSLFPFSQYMPFIR